MDIYAYLTTDFPHGDQEQCNALPCMKIELRNVSLADKGYAITEKPTDRRQDQYYEVSKGERSSLFHVALNPKKGNEFIVINQDQNYGLTQAEALEVFTLIGPEIIEHTRELEEKAEAEGLTANAWR